MNTVAMPSIQGEFQWPRDASEVEKPPVESVAIACATASNRLIPARR